MDKQNQNEVQTDKTIHIHLPGEMRKMFCDLEKVRTQNFEPTSYTSIVMDAVKAYHQQRVSK